MSTPKKTGTSPDTETTAQRQRKIQEEQDQRDQSAPAKDKAKPAAVQAGDRPHPAPPLPADHLPKPGLEADMALKPEFLAPGYKGSGKLEGFSTLITGGDSGIGRAVAVLYAREGADVAIVYLNEHEDAEDTRRCVEAEGKRCLLLPGDVRDAAFCRNAVEQTIQAFGKLDVLVNNAGFQEHVNDITELTEEHFDETMRTNVYGYFHMAKAAVPHLKEGGSIVNTGSVTGLRGSADLIDYSATKGAIHAFTMALASSLAPRGIRVNAVAPGPVWTPFNPADKKPETVEEFGAKTAMKRPAQPEELSPAYVLLASPVCAGYITGTVLPVTGSPG
jgi:NAD(P)-dependent dehydrogenase (short-subunit alcohol dehydrogenase family)